MITRIDKTKVYKDTTKSLDDWFDFIVNVNYEFGLYTEKEFNDILKSDDFQKIFILKEYGRIYDYIFLYENGDILK